MARPENIRLGELLLNNGLITPIQLETALSAKGKSSRRLGKFLIELNYLDEKQIATAVAKQLNIPYLDLKNYDIDKNVFLKLNETQARRFKSVVLKEDKDFLTVGMVDASDLNAYDELVNILKKDIQLICITEESFFEVIEKYYNNQEDIQVIAKELEKDIINVVNVDLKELTLEDAPVIKLFRGVFEDAVRNKASDIHIEPQEDHTMIRFRIDGVLILHAKINSKISAPLVSRLKIISSLDISEKRLPQDGRFQIETKNQKYDVRISILPGNFGESVVMRILGQNNNVLSVDNLNMPENILNVFNKMIHANDGMILVVGPTGSGKTTTLYSALATINNLEKKIITIEDPIEYQLQLINQIPVNEKIDLTFDKVLRSVLRQDPDVIMIGEIRDPETAKIALRSAITGHLIFSTLHTKDAISTPARLIDMGIPNYMVATALQGILSQRLIRKNCTECCSIHMPTKKELIWAENFFGEKVESFNFKIGEGCPTCNKTGLLGRIGVYELLEIDEELANSLYLGDLSKFNELAKEKIKGKTMKDNIKFLLKNGTISIEEIQKLGF